MDKYLTIVNSKNKYNAEDFKDFKYRNDISVNMPDKDEKAFIEEETYKAYSALQEYLKKNNIPCTLNSAGRSVKAQELTQKEIFDLQFESLKKDHAEEEAKALAQKYVDDTVSKPGFSEHHTGLAIDVSPKMTGTNPLAKAKAKIYNIKNADRNYALIANVAHEFGFIVRYTKDNTKATGVKRPEPWHLRYVGKEHAKEYHERAKLDPTYSLEQYVRELELNANVGVGL